MKILVPVDGSTHSNAAIDFVASRSTLVDQATVVQLLNVQPRISARVARAVGRSTARDFQRAAADDVLRPALARLKSAGVEAVTGYALGSRYDAIAGVAVRGRFDLVVMGSRGQTALKGMLFGSVTNAVLAGCSTPLLVVRSGRVPTRRSLVVGIAVDGSRYGLAAVRWALEHQELFGTKPRFQVIHVLPDNEPDRSLATAFEKTIAPVRRLFASAGPEPMVPVRLVHESPGDAIAAHAIRRRVDLLVMGSRGRGALKSLVLGSVAMRVAAKCDKPLLLIRES